LKKYTVLKNLIPESKKLYDVTIARLLDEFLKFNEKTLIMFDLETLGLNPKYEYEQITEVAAWAVSPEKFEILEKMNKRVELNNSAKTLLGDVNSLERANWEKRQRRRGKSAIHDPSDLLKMTRYYEIDVPVEVESVALAKFIQFVEKYPNPILVAHNAEFDINFVNTRGQRYGIILPKCEVLDTLKISRYFFAPTLQTLETNAEAIKLLQSLYRQRGKMSHVSSRLGELADAFEINAKYWHTASADVEMMLGVLRRMLGFLEKHRDVDIGIYQERAISRDVKQTRPRGNSCRKA
jgi:DNA polymerase III alpha subunit (gram-positive type)